MANAAYLHDLFSQRCTNPLKELKLPPDRNGAIKIKRGTFPAEDSKAISLNWLQHRVQEIQKSVPEVKRPLTSNTFLISRREHGKNVTLEKSPHWQVLKSLAAEIPPLESTINGFLEEAAGILAASKEDSHRLRTWRSPISSLSSMTNLKTEMEEIKNNENELKVALEYVTTKAVDATRRIKELEIELTESQNTLKVERKMKLSLESDLEEGNYQRARMQARIDFLERENRRRFDMDLLEIALQQSREDLKELSGRMMRMQVEFSDVVPRNMHEKMEIQFRSLQREHAKLEQQVATADKGREDLINEVEMLRARNADLECECGELKRCGTPRPYWAKCSEFVDGGLSRWRKLSKGKSSRDMLNLILAEFSGDHGVAKRPEFFQGKGTHAHVPKYLQWDGKVRNRHLGVRDVTFMIQDVWAHKRVNDEEMGHRQGMSNFVAQYLEQSFAEACKRFSHVEDIGLFWGILCGEFDEGIYHDRTETAEKILKACEQHCVDHDSERLASDMIQIPSFRDILTKMFPLKSSSAIDQLVGEAVFNLRLPQTANYMQYTKLFDQKEYGEKSGFLKLLEQQEKEEQEKYIKDVLVALGKCETVSLDAVRRAFVIVDPHIEQNILQRYTKWIFAGIHSSNRKPVEDEQVVIQSEKLVRRLKRGNIHRVGPRPY
ncbi:unnamed protein product [Notodromas monacha]|uniref:Translin-associated factor X-interacting protein 1 N-terminal domain-containing protein n=1 Tax=Notodromas monacha TaxID=399045 RepID=A0A7R9BXT8_9CRUS|nr:unnamed protein product [Notodromas monacha]CAG0922618.1 unnamed protein product [Notodromas monacha]